MKRILLIGQDPLFAWALEKKTAAVGYRLEHVYTLTEAKLRMSRFHYEAFLLDGLMREEIEQFSSGEVARSPVFVFNDLDESVVLPNPNARFMKKETAILSLVPSLKELQESNNLSC